MFPEYAALSRSHAAALSGACPDMLTETSWLGGVRFEPRGRGAGWDSVYLKTNGKRVPAHSTLPRGGLLRSGGLPQPAERTRRKRRKMRKTASGTGWTNPASLLSQEPSTAEA